MDAIGIAKALGLQRSGRTYTGRCPSCGYQTGFTVGEHRGVVLVRCHAGGCTQDDVIEALRAQGLWAGDPDPEWKAPAAISTDKHAKAALMGDIARQIWRQTVPAAGTYVETYLRSRGITGTIPPTIRYAASLLHKPTGLYLPAMVAAFAHWPDNRICAIHRTYLTADGSRKAPVSDPKMTLGPADGAAVRLAPAGSALLIAEGIETTLSAMQATGLPGWAAFAAGNIAKLVLPPPPAAAEITIAADNDTNGVGQSSAHAAAERWCLEGRKVRVVVPPTADTDWNDILRSAA